MALPAVGDLLADHQEFHSTLQLDHFITIRSGGTLYGCYKQSLRELHSRLHSLRQRYIERRKLELKLEKADDIKALEIRWRIDSINRETPDAEREFIRFYGQAAAIREALAADGIRFPLDAEARDHLDRQMWAHRIRCMAAVEFIAQGRLSAGTIEVLQALPSDMRKSLAADILKPERHEALIDWYMHYEISIPAPAKIDTESCRKLIECSVS